MMSPKTSLRRGDLTNITTSRAVRFLLQLIPLTVGIVHQVSMLFGRFQPLEKVESGQTLTKCPSYDQIPVFVDPPGSICPWVTLEYEWWIVLALITSCFYVLVYLRRLPNLPRRFAVPFYCYLLFLLVMVKPL